MWLNWFDDFLLCIYSSIYVPFANSNLSLRETYIFGKVLEVVEHVEPVEVDGARRHRVVRESQRLSQLEDKPVDNGHRQWSY